MTHSLRERRRMQWLISIVLRCMLLLLFTFAQKIRGFNQRVEYREKHTHTRVPMRIYIVGQYGLLDRQRPTEHWGGVKRRVAGKALETQFWPSAAEPDRPGPAAKHDQLTQQLSPIRWARHAGPALFGGRVVYLITARSTPFC